MLKDLSDNELLRRYRETKTDEGKKYIIELLYIRYVKMFRYICNKNTFLGEYDDLFQECYLALLETMEHFDDKSEMRFKNYLYRCVVWHLMRWAKNNQSIFQNENNIISLNETIKDTDESLERADMVACDLDIEQLTIDRLMNDAIKKELDDILSLAGSEKDKNLIMAHYINSKSFDELAVLEGTTEQIIKSRSKAIIQNIKNKVRARKIKSDTLELYGSSCAYRSGIGLFNRTGSSSTELTVFKIMKAEDCLRG